MKQTFLTAMALLLFLSCTKKTPLQQLIHDADVVKVFVFSGNATVLHYETNDIDKIQAWRNFIADDTVQFKNDCLPIGKIIFKTSNDSTEMDFSLKNNCRFVSYKLNGSNRNSTLTELGVQYIDSLMKVQ